MTLIRHYSQTVRQALSCLPVASLIVFCLFSFSRCMPALAESGDTTPGTVDEPPLRTIKFMVTFTKGINSKETVEGQQVEGTLQDDLKLDEQLIAPAGSTIFGHIEKLTASRTLVKSVVSSQKRFKRHSSLVINFDRIVTPNKQELTISGQACEQFSLFSNGHVVREIIVGPDGELIKTGDTSMIHNQDFGISIPKSWVTFKDHFQIDIQAGDQLTVEATEPYGMLVSAKVLKSNPAQESESGAKPSKGSEL